MLALPKEQRPGYQPPRRTLERERLQAGMQAPLPPHNVGFRLLQRMGFQQGQGVGREQRQGLREPLQVELREGRAGLGMGAAPPPRKRSHPEAQEPSPSSSSSSMGGVQVEEFRRVVAREFLGERVARDLRHAW